MTPTVLTVGILNLLDTEVDTTTLSRPHMTRCCYFCSEGSSKLQKSDDVLMCKNATLSEVLDVSIIDEK